MPDLPADWSKYDVEAKLTWLSNKVSKTDPKVTLAQCYNRSAAFIQAGAFVWKFLRFLKHCLSNAPVGSKENMALHDFMKRFASSVGCLVQDAQVDERYQLDHGQYREGAFPITTEITPLNGDLKIDEYCAEVSYCLCVLG